MDFFKWKDSFSIGIGEIDRQHRRFLEYLNICHLNLVGSDRKRIDAALLANLKEYAATHFRFEEAGMKAGNPVEVEHHMKQHKYFEKQLDKLEAAQAKGSAKVTEELLAFMRDWFLDHILEEDKKMKSSIRGGAG